MNTKRLLIVFLVYFCTPTWTLNSDEEDSSSAERQSKDIREDSRLRVDELITKHGYIGETHNVETEDGYILTAHRIRNDNGKPIFLQHGLIDSSAGYVVMGPNASLGKITNIYFKLGKGFCYGIFYLKSLE
uniref:Partial AB-hydrolase lipase domain-containing protein n=1 Tax=Megaselia scalaris TaxID=36166 RepID=T1H0F1_MEGSC